PLVRWSATPLVRGLGPRTANPRAANPRLRASHRRFFLVRLGAPCGLLLLMCGASPLAGLFDVAPDRRFGAVGIAGTQRLEDRDMALGNLVQRSMGDGDCQAGGDREPHRLPHVLE